MNLEEIARLAGVSRSTVSRVVNDDRRVSAEVRSRVREIIEQHDYHPNAAARSLASKRTRILGLLLPQAVNSVFSDAFFPTLIGGAIEVCNAADHSLMMLMEPSADPLAVDKFYRRVLRGQHMDGVIIASSVVDDPVVKRLLDEKFPFLLIGRHPRYDEISFVDVANRSGAERAVQHLLGHGYRRIGNLAGPANMIAFIDRHAGYVAALEGAGLAVDAALTVHGALDHEAGYLAMKRLLDERPDAVFASSDPQAFGAMRAIADAGLRVPEDIAIISFDDLPAAARTNPPLSTVYQPITELGREAVRLLLRMLEQPASERAAQHISLPTRLAIRRSCGCNR